MKTDYWKEREELDQVIEELQEYIDLDGTEAGDCAESLVDLYNSYMDYVNPEFLAALQKEIRDHLKGFKENCEIVEEEETRTITETRKVLREKS